LKRSETAQACGRASARTGRDPGSGAGGGEGVYAIAVGETAAERRSRQILSLYFRLGRERVQKFQA